MGNNADVVFTDTDRLLLQKDEEVRSFSKSWYFNVNVTISINKFQHFINLREFKDVLEASYEGCI